MHAQRASTAGGLRHRRLAPQRARVPLPAVHGLPRPRRADRAVRRPLVLVDAPAGARLVPPRATTSAIRAVPLDDAVRERVERDTGARPRGPIRLLTHLRYFGHVLQPGELLLLLRRRRPPRSRPSSPRSPTRRGANATPTCCPRRQCHAHAHAAASWRSFDKRSTSRRSAMERDYDWRFRRARRRPARAHGRAARRRGAEFDATLALERRPMIGATTLACALLRFPLMTRAGRRGDPLAGAAACGSSGPGARPPAHPPFPTPDRIHEQIR